VERVNVASDFFLNFLGIPEEFRALEDARVVILPVPFEKSTSWGEGTAQGPLAILEASHQLEYYDMETGTEVYKQGIHTLRPLKTDSAEEMVEAVYQQVKSLLFKNKFVVTLGGEHTVSLGPIKAYLEHFSELTILSLDAHADMREDYLDDRLSHACVMARTLELTEDIALLGTRTLSRSELDNVAKVRMLGAREFLESKKSREEFLEKLSPNVYLSFDVDVWAPSIMPSTGTPVPGGLGWYDTLDFLKLLFKLKTVVGFDVVELSPSPHNRAPDFLVAKLVNTLLIYKFYY